MHPYNHGSEKETHEYILSLRAEIERLRSILVTARIALDTCRAGMKLLTDDGVHSLPFRASADQFAAAWRDLQAAVMAAEAAQDF